MVDFREYFKQWPEFYYAVAVVFGPVLMTGVSAKKFLRHYPSDGTILNLGSGPKIVAPGVTNVDIHPYRGVSMVADVLSVPLPDGAAERIISDNVLEHVKEPYKAVAEMHRLLAPGGYVYISTPFLYPFHSSPSDYQRWTVEGYRQLFKDFKIVEIGTRAGPFSALCTWACHFTGFVLSFGSPTLNSFFTNASMFVLFPIKLPDIIFNFWPNSHEVAAVLYCVLRKS